MTLSPRTISIIGALFLSGSFIALGYYLSSPLSPQFASADGTEELLKAYAKKDTDADGLPDWQESLYGTDPENAYSTAPGVTDAEAVKNGTVKPRFASEALPAPVITDATFTVASPETGSVTDEFAKSFFEGYIETGDPTGTNDALILELVSDFKSRITAALSSSYTNASVRISASATVSDYAGEVEQALKAHEVPDDAADPVALVDAYILKEDSSVRPRLLLLAESYSATAQDLALIPTPSSLTSAHLSLIRSFDQLGKATQAVANYETDPVVTLGGIGIYTPAATELNGALQSIASAIQAEGEPASGAPGAFILGLVRGTLTP